MGVKKKIVNSFKPLNGSKYITISMLVFGNFKLFFRRITGFSLRSVLRRKGVHEGWNFNSGNYLFTTDTK